MPAYMAVVLAAFVWLGAVSGASAGDKVVATAARLGEHPNHTRFVVELSASAQYRVFTLADPYRVVIDLPEVDWQLPADTGLTGKGLVKGYRYGQYSPGHSRIVIDLWKPSEIAADFILPAVDAESVRLVVNLTPTSREQFIAKAGWPSDIAPDGTGDRATKETKDKTATAAKPLIVIDPGHGGVDPGAQGVSGSQEKEIVLDVGKTLRDLLIANGGYDVVMTRDDDAFIPLRERVDIARRSRADLFISLHADSIGRSGIRGASVYTLSEKASDAEAARLAESENAADIISGANLSTETAEVRDILIDLAQRETKNFSVNFAQTLAGQLSGETGVVQRPHRYAGFKVLKAPDVPSVLLELGFLSDEQDEEALTSAVWQTRVAGAIFRSIEDYFGKQKAPAPAISKPIPTPKRAIRDNLTLGAAE